MNLELGALPHGLAVVGTMAVFFCMFGILCMLVGNELGCVSATVLRLSAVSC